MGFGPRQHLLLFLRWRGSSVSWSSCDGRYPFRGHCLNDRVKIDHIRGRRVLDRRDLDESSRATSEPPPTDKATVPGRSQRSKISWQRVRRPSSLAEGACLWHAHEMDFRSAKAYAHVKAEVSIEGGEPDPNDKVRIDATRTPTDWDRRKTLLQTRVG